jgi:hypothetical protein
VCRALYFAPHSVLLLLPLLLPGWSVNTPTVSPSFGNPGVLVLFFKKNRKIQWKML